MPQLPHRLSAIAAIGTALVIARRGGKADGPAPSEHKASRKKTQPGKITPRVKGQRARRRNDEKRVETHSWSPLEE